MNVLLKDLTTGYTHSCKVGDIVRIIARDINNDICYKIGEVIEIIDDLMPY